jgi:hypothetical protein
MTNMLTSYPKTKQEESQVEAFHRAMSKRRASHHSSEHELEVKIAAIKLRSFMVEIN